MTASDARALVGRARTLARASLASPAAVDTGLLVAAQYVASAIGLVTAVVAARLLGPTEYGLAAITVALPNLVLAVVAVKTEAVTIHYLSTFRRDRAIAETRALCKVGCAVDFAVGCVALLVVAAAVMSLDVGRIAGLADAPVLVVAYAGCFPLLSLASTGRAVLTAWGRFGTIAALRIADRLVALACTLTVIALGLGAAGIVLATAVSEAIAGVATLVVASAALSADGVGRWWRAPVSPVAALRGELARAFGWNNVVSTASGVLGQGPVLLLGAVRGPTDAAFLRLATAIVAVLGYVEAAMGRVVYPMLATGSGDVVARVRQWTLRRGLPVALGLLALVPLIPIGLPLVVGDAYASMVPGTQAMVAGAAASSLFFWLGSYHYAAHGIARWAKAHLAYTGILLGALWLLAPRGFTAAALVLAAGRALFCTALALAVLARGGRRWT